MSKSAFLRIVALIGCLYLVGIQQTFASGECPIAPTTFRGVTITNPDPPPEPGQFPADMDDILDYVTSNNITSLTELLDHTPTHMRTIWALVAQTGGLHQTSLQQPGLMLVGSDAKFMMNISSTPSDPLYDVADIAYLQDDGDWEFRSLDFRTSPPTLSPDGGDGGKCRQCHAEGGANNANAPMRPFWGTYLHWPGIFSGLIDGAEELTPREKVVLDEISEGRNNNDRFAIIKTDDYGKTINLRPYVFSNSLTAVSHEMGTAMAESIYKRMQRSDNYRKLREEFLLMSLCNSNRAISRENKARISVLLESMGARPEDFSFHTGWGAVFQALDLNPWHEFPVDVLGENLDIAIMADNLRYNPVTPGLVEHVQLLVINELAQERADIADLLSAYAPDFISPNAQCPSYQNNLKNLVDHAIYTNFTLQGNARHAVRTKFMDTEVFRVNQSYQSVSESLCELLVNDIDLPGTTNNNPTSNTPTLPNIPSPPTTTKPPSIPTPPNAATPLADTCSQGQAPTRNVELIAGQAICLPTVTEGWQIQMHVYVSGDDVGKDLEIQLAHGSGNGDLLYRAAGRPNLSLFDRVSNGSDTSENLVVPSIQRGWNYIHVWAQTELTGATLFLQYN